MKQFSFDYNNILILKTYLGLTEGSTAGIAYILRPLEKTYVAQWKRVGLYQDLHRPLLREEGDGAPAVPESSSTANKITVM